MHGLGKVLPRQAWIPVPFFCDVFVGPALYGSEDHNAFMAELNERMQALRAEGNFPPWE